MLDFEIKYALVCIYIRSRVGGLNSHIFRADGAEEHWAALSEHEHLSRSIRAYNDCWDPATIFFFFFIFLFFLIIYCLSKGKPN